MLNKLSMKWYLGAIVILVSLIIQPSAAQTKQHCTKLGDSGHDLVLSAECICSSLLPGLCASNGTPLVVVDKSA